MLNCNTKSLGNCFKNTIVRSATVIFLLIGIAIGGYISLWLGIVIFGLFIFGCSLTAILLENADTVSEVIRCVKDLCGYPECAESSREECEVCGTAKCGRHMLGPVRDPWRQLLVNKELDAAVDSFFSKILNEFVCSWFAEVSQNDSFVHSIKESLREAVCRLVLRIKQINASELICTKLLPVVYAHNEMIQKVLSTGDISLDKLPSHHILNERTIHPAVLNRQTEMEYLRMVAQCLIPRLFRADHFDCKIFVSLIRELLACWVLLPLLDVIADPNLLNLLVVTVTNPPRPDTVILPNVMTAEPRVELLQQFIQKKTIIVDRPETVRQPVDDILHDQKQLYAFMQFLKREGAVDVLRFYLDVDNLNRDLLDPRVTTDPAKLSSLHQQSEKLLVTYRTVLADGDKDAETDSLNSAHAKVKASLEGKWRQSFYRTSEYYKLVYGARTISDDENYLRDQEHCSGGAVSRIGSKLKGAIRGTHFDGTPVEACEVPTVWDGFAEPQNFAGSNTIYSSVTQKLRKERGQNLDAFMVSLMQSIEQTTDVGVDVVELSDRQNIKKPKPPGMNMVFGDLFELKRYEHTHLAQTSSVQGPSKCFIYFLSKIVQAPKVLVRFAIAVVRISERTVDSLISTTITRLIRKGLEESRLAALIRLLEEQIFGPKQPEPTAQELLGRQQLARTRMAQFRPCLANVCDTFQSPPLNKHLMYCLLDIVLIEIYPEFKHTAKD